MKKSVVAKLAFGLLALSYVGAGAYSYDAMGRRLNNAQNVNAPKIWRVQPEQVKTTAAEQFTQTGLYKAPDANTLPIGQDISFVPQRVKRLNMTPMPARKDTRMLVTGWGRYALARGWDRSHVNEAHMTEEEAARCWLVAVFEVNRFFAQQQGLVNPNANPENPDVLHYLTQDEIKYHVFHVDGQSPVLDFPFWADGSSGHDGTRMEKAMKFALGLGDGDVVAYFGNLYDGYAASHNIRNDIVNSIDEGKPAIIFEDAHVMVIDAYAVTTRGVRWVRLLNPTNDGSFQWRTLNSVDIVGYVWYNKNNISVRYSNNEVRRDSDGDGIVDFDEKYRFKTKALIKNVDDDSDKDGVKDKQEILNRTLLEMPEFVPFDASQNHGVPAIDNGLIMGVKKEVWADVNNNQFNAERDASEIADGTSAGLLNGGHRPLYVENGVPGDFDIYAVNALTLENNCSCLNKTKKEEIQKCTYATESKLSSYAARIYQENLITYLYSKGSVLVGGNARVTNLNLFSSTSTTPSYSLNDNGSVGVVARMSADLWPWEVNRTWNSYTTGSTDKVVHANETYTLTPNSNIKSLQVEPNGKLNIQPGVIKLQSLVLAEGSTVLFVRSSQKTTIHVKGNFVWKPTLRVANSSEYKNLAKNFKVVYEGSNTSSTGLKIASNWAGVLFAPKATLTLGSSGKKIYGRFVGSTVTVKAGAIIESYHGQEW